MQVWKKFTTKNCIVAVIQEKMRDRPDNGRERAMTSTVHEEEQAILTLNSRHFRKENFVMDALEKV